jgi:hypothetical protein
VNNVLLELEVNPLAHHFNLLVLQGRKINYKCMKTKLSGKYLNQKKDEESEYFMIFHNEELCDL